MSIHTQNGMESTFVNTKAITQLGLIPEVSFVSKCDTMTCHRGEMDVQVQPIHVLGARRGWGSATNPNHQSRYPISPALSSLVFWCCLYIKPLYVIRGPTLHYTLLICTNTKFKLPKLPALQCN